MRRNSDVLTPDGVFPLSWFKWDKLGRRKEKAAGMTSLQVWRFMYLIKASELHLSLMLLLCSLTSFGSSK